MSVEQVLRDSSLVLLGSAVQSGLLAHHSPTGRRMIPEFQHHRKTESELAFPLSYHGRRYEVVVREIDDG